MPSLILISEDEQRQVFELGRAMLMIGRDDEAGIQVSHISVSRNHASIVFDKGDYLVRDNGSTNGTFVNGTPVSRCILKHHDLVRFGSCLFLVDMKDDVKRGPKGTEIMTVTHVGSKDGNVVEVRPKSLIPGAPVRPVQVILSSSSTGQSKLRAPSPKTR